MRWPILFVLVAAPPGFAAERPVSFQNDVMAVLSRAGCNAGACHGNLNGKGGLKLSLRGEDAESDRTALTRGMLGRRIDALDPDASLILKKATGSIPHEGGSRFAKGSSDHTILKNWIATGGVADPADTPKPNKLALNGTSHILVAPAERVQLSAVATYSDGTTRDVTGLATYELTTVGTFRVTPGGEVRREQLGEGVVLVRYLDLQVPVRVAFLPNRPVPDLGKVPANNAIDKLVYADLGPLRLRPSELSGDGVFLRRVYLDTCGIVPTADESRAFSADTSHDKRTKVIDALLARPEFAAFWSQKWADLLRNEEKTLDYKGVQIFHRWIKNWIAADKPLNEFAREILSARGSTYTTAPANFYRAIRDPYQRAESVAQVFLGLRVSCAKCHNHPFDRWTQDEYHSFAALFARIDYRVLANKKTDGLDQHEFLGEQIVLATTLGELPHPRGGNAAPKFLGAATPDLGGRADRLTALADWVAAPGNPFFARAQANRIWAHLLGRGIVEPLDDFKIANPATNPALLEHLTGVFTDGGYRLRPLVKHILNSRTYQLSATPNETNRTDDSHYSRAFVQPLEAEQLLDAMAKAMDSRVKFPAYPLGIRAGEVPATPMERGRANASAGTRFLKVFGKPDRLLTCECERNDDPGLLQAFQMMTGGLLHNIVREPDNLIGKMLATKASDSTVLDELYHSTLCRPPTDVEAQKLLKSIAEAEDRRAAWEDVAWALLNSKEFLLRR